VLTGPDPLIVSDGSECRLNGRRAEPGGPAPGRASRSRRAASDSRLRAGRLHASYMSPGLLAWCPAQASRPHGWRARAAV